MAGVVLDCSVHARFACCHGLHDPNSGAIPIEHGQSVRSLRVPIAKLHGAHRVALGARRQRAVDVCYRFHPVFHGPTGRLDSDGAVILTVDRHS